MPAFSVLTLLEYLCRCTTCTNCAASAYAEVVWPAERVRPSQVLSNPALMEESSGAAAPASAPSRGREVPEQFLCPITLQLMEDPVRATHPTRRDAQANATPHSLLAMPPLMIAHPSVYRLCSR